MASDDTRMSHVNATIDKHDPRDRCAICLEAVTERAVAAPCSHALFDYLCLLTWLLEHNARCPLCNGGVTKVFHDFRSPNEYAIFAIPATRSKSGGGEGSRSELGCSRGRNRDDSSSRLRRRRDPSPVTESTALSRRRQVYRYGLYALHVGSSRTSKYQNITPKSFAASAVLQARARKWLRRELTVFDFLTSEESAHEKRMRTVQNAEFLLEYAIAILKTMGIKDSDGRAEKLLAEFLGREHARLLLHELEAWLRSPFDKIEDWDNTVQYQALPVRDHARQADAKPICSNTQRQSTRTDSYPPQ